MLVSPLDFDVVASSILRILRASRPVCVYFSDTATAYDAADFSTLLFGTGNFSMKDYYEEVSYGLFTVAAGPDGIGGWYTAQSTHDYYGANDAGGQDMWPGDLVYEAAVAADGAGYDFAPYDQDGDCLVDNLIIVHQGGGEEFVGALETNIWSHSWSLAGAAYYGYSHHGPFTTDSDCAAHPGQKIVVNKYTMQPELYATTSRLTTMGVYAHEFGHALGLPDLYDVDYSSEGVGDWSVMSSGSWNRSGGDGGNRPAHIEPWGKWLLGWITPTPVTCASTVSLPSAATSSAGRVLTPFSPFPQQSARAVSSCAFAQRRCRSEIPHELISSIRAGG
jgi:immune inhibitor A